MSLRRRSVTETGATYKRKWPQSGGQAGAVISSDGLPFTIPTLVRSFIFRYALVSQKALVSWAVHQDTAFLTGRAIRGCLGHGDFVFSSAFAFMRSGEPFNEFGHARNMRCGSRSNVAIFRVYRQSST